MPLNQIGPCSLQKLDLHSHRLLVAPDVEFNRITFEFPFYYFLKVRALAFQLNIPIAGDRMTIDSEKNITRPKDGRRWSGLYDRVHQNASVVVFQSEKLSLRWVLQLGITERKIDIFVVMPVADIF